MDIALDSSVLMGLLIPDDTWHRQAVALRDAIQQGEPLFTRIETLIGAGSITWVFPDVPFLYLEIIEQIRRSSGALNFNDALIALSCREQRISAIASFDRDFDSIPWLRRMSQPQDL